MIEAVDLTKRYGSQVAVDGVSFTVAARPGDRVPGPERGGQVDHDAADSGSGCAYLWPRHGQRASFRAARLVRCTRVGALLEARAIHTGRSARNHLLAMAATAGIGRRRVDDVIDMVGLAGVADRRAGGFSLGMGQRLGIASALLGDPQILILDEPVNGLDPDGIRWIRTLLRRLADEGRHGVPVLASDE